MRTTPEVHPPVHPDPFSGEGADLDRVSDELPFRDYLRIVYRRKWMILTIVGIGVALGAVRNWITTPLYYAQATLEFDIDMNVLGNDRPLLPLDQRDWMTQFFPTQIAILQGRDAVSYTHLRAHETP